ncbi:MAG: ABC transporter ATP-binding protein [Candidatus Micrarchaeota archaeon]
MPEVNAVEVSGLSVSYGGSRVLDGISLSVAQGEFVALLGAVGTGKTTLLLCLNGVIPKLVPAKVTGKVVAFGLDSSMHPVQKLSRDVAFVFQDPDDQIFSLTVEEEVGFALKNAGLPAEKIKARVADALKLVGIADFASRDPSTLSFGQKQKVAIACAVATDARLLCLDEPASALDHRSCVELFELLRRLNSQGRTIVISSHDTDLLAKYAARFVVLGGGKVILDGGKEVFRSTQFRDAGLKVPCILEG